MRRACWVCGGGGGGGEATTLTGGGTGRGAGAWPIEVMTDSAEAAAFSISEGLGPRTTLAWARLGMSGSELAAVLSG